jgi:glutamate--cysteine ligase
MSVAHDETPVRSLEDLIAPLHESCKPRAEWRIGTEAEKHGVFRDGSAVPFVGERSVSAVLDRLAERHGWKRERESDDDGSPWISLSRGDASITLEPGGQLELSGAPLRTIHETAAEFRAHLAEVHPIADELGITYLGLGFHPFARREDLPWVPKLRYPIMREYLPTRGALALDMMLRTCTVQSNHDYATEEDAMRKLRVALRLQPIATAMFANSPFVERRATGERSHRAAVWLAVDPDRSGLLPWAWARGRTFRDYVEWALDVPMFLIKRDGKLLRNTGQTFRAYLAEGYRGARATREDWMTHLNTLFPEVRLKKTLEMRGADSQRTELIPALPALWKGLIEDDEALTAAEAIADRWSAEEIEAARPQIARDALRTPLAGREIGEWASDLLTVAERGLRRIGEKDAAGNDESIHLAPLHRLVDEGRSPADALLAAIDAERDPIAPVIEHSAL